LKSQITGGADKIMRYQFIIFILGIVMLSACSPANNAIDNDEIIDTHDSITNFSRFEAFLKNIQKQHADTIRITNYTIEGAPIFHDLLFDGSTINLVIDNSEDAYRGDGPTTYSFECQLISFNDNAYILKNCNNGEAEGDIRLLDMDKNADK